MALILDGLAGVRGRDLRADERRASVVNNAGPTPLPLSHSWNSETAHLVHDAVATDDIDIQPQARSLAVRTIRIIEFRSEQATRLSLPDRCGSLTSLVFGPQLTWKREVFPSV